MTCSWPTVSRTDGRDPIRRALDRIAAARARLVLDRPLLGTLTLHLVPVPCDPSWCATLGTDARHVWFNVAFVASASLDDLQFRLAHEALHAALGHFARRAHRVRDRWDVACDHAVNLLLESDGLRVPAGALADPAFRGMAAEDIYPLIPESPEQRPFDRHAFERGSPGGGLAGYLGEIARGEHERSGATSASPGNDGVPVDDPATDAWDDAGSEVRRHRPAGSAAFAVPPVPRAAELEQLWKSRLATAAQAAREAGRLGQSWQRVLERLLEPTLPWRALLARYVVSAAREDYTFQRPPRRDGDAIFPRLARGSLRVVAALDTSGSITAAELDEFAGELDALKSQVRAEVTVHACDERLAPEGPWIFDPWESVTLPPSLSGGGGTRFTPLFDWVERERLAPDLLIYFTDAQGEFPPEAPAYPVLWLVKGNAAVPFGERVQLN